ncbi:MAG TPA: BON domain-containing protein [Flavipsychrobacter sp.]|nr:BON domain-containing protein [Flavipsychrobacter sp.]
MANDYRAHRTTGNDWREDAGYNQHYGNSGRHRGNRNSDSDYVYRNNDRYTSYNHLDEDRYHPSNYGYGSNFGTGSYPASSYKVNTDRNYRRNDYYGVYNPGYAGYDRDYSYGRYPQEEGYGYNRPEYEYGTSDRGDYQRRNYSNYNNNYNRQDGNDRYEDRRQNDRDWWDKTSDEVASWFGDEDAERRRRRDEQQSHRGRGPKGYQRSDERIREDVNDRLTDDPWVDASDIEVSVNDREVILSGEVHDRSSKRRAEDIAEGVLGVQNVENRIRVNQEEYVKFNDYNYPTATTSAGSTDTNSRVENGKARTSSKTS